MTGAEVVLGVGIDIVDLARFTRLTSAGHTRLLQRWFTPSEQAACKTASRPAVHYARVFAAKEAVFKALALPDWDGRVPWSWIGVRAHPGADAAISLSGPVAAAVGPGIRFAVEISTAPAFVSARAVAYRASINSPR